jgi:hypothetical protein
VALARRWDLAILDRGEDDALALLLLLGIDELARVLPRLDRKSVV